MTEKKTEQVSTRICTNRYLEMQAIAEVDGTSAADVARVAIEKYLGDRFGLINRIAKKLAANPEYKENID